MIYTGTTLEPMSGLYVQSLTNTKGSFLSFPVIWIEDENGLINEGKIETQLLIVGTKVHIIEEKKTSDRRKVATKRTT